MAMIKRSLLLLLWLAVALAACSRNQANPPEEPATPVVALGTVTLVPVESPKALVTDNRGVPVVGFLWTGIANTVMDKSKSAEFDARHADYRRQIGEKLTGGLQRGLLAQGFQVRLASPHEVARNRDNELDFGKFAGHEVVLDVFIDDFAMYSGRTSANYLPLINTSVVLAKPEGSRRERFLDGWYSYGAQASYTGDGYIQSSTKFSFPDFPSLMDQPALVVQAFDEGIELTVKHLLQDFRRQFKPIAPPAPTLSRLAPSPALSDAATPSANSTEPPTKKAKARKARQPRQASAAVVAR